MDQTEKDRSSTAASEGRCTIYVPWTSISDILKTKECIHYHQEGHCQIMGKDCPSRGRDPLKVSQL